MNSGLSSARRTAGELNARWNLAPRLASGVEAKGVSFRRVRGLATCGGNRRRRAGRGDGEERGKSNDGRNNDAEPEAFSVSSIDLHPVGNTFGKFRSPPNFCHSPSMSLRRGLRPAAVASTVAATFSRAVHTPPPRKPKAAPKLMTGRLAGLIGPRPTHLPVRRQRLASETTAPEGSKTRKVLVRRPLEQRDTDALSQESSLARPRAPREPRQQRTSSRTDVPDAERPPARRVKRSYGLAIQDTPAPTSFDPTVNAPWRDVDLAQLPKLKRTTHFLSADYDVLKSRGNRQYLCPSKLFRLFAVPSASLVRGGAQPNLPPFPASNRPFTAADDNAGYSSLDGRAGSGWVYASSGTVRVLVVSSKTVSKLAVERRRIMRRTKAALDIVVNRGVSLPHSEL